MTDFSKLPQCPSHGRFTGRLCPICEWNPLAPIAAVHAPAPEPTEDRSAWHKGPEVELHGWLEAELIRLEISYIHARTDKKSTIANGTPDFACFSTGSDGICRFCFIELKNKAGRLSQIQIEVIRDLESQKIPVLVTGSFTEAKTFMIEKLNLEPKPL